LQAASQGRGFHPDWDHRRPVAFFVNLKSALSPESRS
jgi:hypothetical protein